MADMNELSIKGRVVKDADVFRFDNGGKKAAFAVATSSRWTDDDGKTQEKTQFHNVVAFNRAADIAEKYIQKGLKVFVRGASETRDYEDKGGVNRRVTELVLRGAPGERMDFDLAPRVKAPEPG
jgi:single-strand DNA-binding protein